MSYFDANQNPYVQGEQGYEVSCLIHKSADVWRTPLWLMLLFSKHAQSVSFSCSLFSREGSKSSSSTADMIFSLSFFPSSFPQMFFHKHSMHKQMESSAEDFNLNHKHSIIMWCEKNWSLQKACKTKMNSYIFLCFKKRQDTCQIHCFTPISVFLEVICNVLFCK